MSAQAEVAPPSDGPDAPEGSLRVRPPSPLPPRRRAVIGVVAALIVVVGAVLVLQARSDDSDAVPGAAWRKLPVPRSARVDAFEADGALGPVPDFGTWETAAGSFVAADGLLRSGDDFATATVDAGTADVLVHAQVVRVTPGSGLLISSSAVGVPGLWLRATGSGAWALVWERSGPAPQVIRAFAAPTADVSVQVIRRGDEIRVAFDDQITVVDVPAETAGGTFVGLVAEGPGNEFDLFGYLPLAAG